MPQSWWIFDLFVSKESVMQLHFIPIWCFIQRKMHANWQWSMVNPSAHIFAQKYFYLRSNIFWSIFKCMTNIICVQTIISPAAAELKNGLQLLGACHCHRQWITIFGDACFINTALVFFLFTFRCYFIFFSCFSFFVNGIFIFILRLCIQMWVCEK